MNPWSWKMALKRDFNDEEKIGLTQREIELGEKYLRKHKTAGAIGDVQSLKLYEMFLIGSSLHEIQQQFPEYEIGQIVLTAALKKWGMDRDKMQGTLRDRVRAKVVKSVIEQVDFLTSMLSVANVEHVDEMRKYIIDPNNPKPMLRIKSIKDYKEVAEVLGKIVQGATPGAKSNNISPMFDALAPNTGKNVEKKRDDDDIDLDSLLDKGEE
jgi:hypothetical protein